jgi:hypothetical protein
MSDFRLQFLPKGPQAAPLPPGGSSGHKHPSNHGDPESTPARQLDRRLGAWGVKLLDHRIKVEFQRQLGGRMTDAGRRRGWQDHIDEIATAFELALNNQAAVLEKNKEETNERRMQDAAVLAFVFSLITLPVIRWAGAFIEHRVSPALFERKQTKSISFYNVDGFGPIRQKLIFTETVANQEIAQFFGGIAEDILGGIAGGLKDKLSKNPKTQNSNPYSGIADGNIASVVKTTRDQLTGALEAGTAIVLDEIEDAVHWMEHEPEFGHAWAQASGGNETIAMDLIVRQFTTVRDKWAAASVYFGQNPEPLPATLARDFERILWAAYIDGSCGQVLNREKIYSEHPYGGGNAAQASAELNRFLRVLDGLAFGNAIVNRLKLLNIVIATTEKGKEAQRIWRTKGEDGASVDVEDDVDRLAELKGLWSWARQHPSDCLAEALAVGKQGVRRAPEPLSQSP